MGGIANYGMLSQVQLIPYSIGYEAWSYISAFNVSWGYLVNRHGTLCAPSDLDHIEKAMELAQFDE